MGFRERDVDVGSGEAVLTTRDTLCMRLCGLANPPTPSVLPDGPAGGPAEVRGPLEWARTGGRVKKPVPQPRMPGVDGLCAKGDTQVHTPRMRAC